MAKLKLTVDVVTTYLVEVEGESTNKGFREANLHIGVDQAVNGDIDNMVVLHAQVAKFLCPRCDDWTDVYDGLDCAECSIYFCDNCINGGYDCSDTCKDHQEEES